MSADERAAFLKKEPKATDLLRPYVGSREHINGGERWILTLGGVSPQTLRTMPKVLDIIDQVRRYRLGELPAVTILTVKTTGRVRFRSRSRGRRRPSTSPSYLLNLLWSYRKYRATAVLADRKA